jgi:hypothetical protein
MLLHTKYAAVAHIAERQFMHAVENLVQLLMLKEGTLRLIFSMKEGQNFDRAKT